MIDFDELQKAYDENRFYALQLEVGDVCYQDCIYCYMNALHEKKNFLTDEKIYEILNESKKLKITAIEWLGGEPLLRNSIFDFMQYAKDLGFRNNLWTGGLPLAEKEISRKLVGLCNYGLIAFHLSTINKKLYQQLHPTRPETDVDTIISGVENLLEMGYPSSQLLNSVTFTGFQTAEDLIETMEFFYEKYKIVTSINVYHTYLRPDVRDYQLEQFIPKDAEVAKVYRKYISFMNLKNFPMNCVNKQYCSATLAVLNDGKVSPCATIRVGCPQNVIDNKLSEIVEKNLDFLIFKPFKSNENLPEECQICSINDICFGCRSRSFAAGLGLYGRDPRCFRFKKLLEMN